MKMSMTDQPKGHLWLVFTMLFVTFAIHGEGASSFTPPSLSTSPTYAPVIKAIGKVYCYRCFNEAHPEESHGKKHLEGAMVKVTCQANDQAIVAFGYTKSNGKYSVILKGLPISNNYGADSCKVELHGAPGGSDCNVPIELNLSGLSVYSKSSGEVVLQANQIMAFASKKTSECSTPHMPPPAHPYNSPPLPYQYPSPPASHKSQPLPYQYSPPPSNQFPPPAYQYPSPPLNNYASPPPYQQSMPPNSYQNLPPTQGVKSPVPSHKYLPPPYYYNSPPPQYQYNNVPPLLAYQYPPPPNIHKSPLLPSSPATPYFYNSPPPNQYSPPPYSYQFSPPPAHYSPQLPPNAPDHLHPKVPHAKSLPLTSASPQPLYQHNSPPPPIGALSSPPLHSIQSPPPTDQLS
ncbi:extensin-2-like [Panicum miliaceum]|uniref:Extensin-2-like n=1 Tax=Panicum miliaceum TaxID=4540 RepID=A0A3L6SL19_PANMI|nr:extensin-2-like [Panicum miliaceum]